MPYDPGISYRGDQYIFSALSGLGQDVSKAMDERKKIAQTGAYNDFIMQAARDRGQVTEDEYNRYLTASANQKTGIAAGHAAQIAADLHESLAKSQITENQAQAAAAQAHAGYFQGLTSNLGQDPMQGQVVYHPTTGEPIGIYGPSGQVQYFPAQATEKGNEPVITDSLKIDGREIPGIGTNRKTGQYVYYGDSGIIRDDKTGALGTRDTRGNFKPLSAQQITAMDMDPNNPLRQTTTPQEKSSWQKLFGGGNAPAAANGGSPNVSQTPPPAAAPAGKVRVISPQGVPGFVPAERVKDYLEAGYTQG
jgi:hypothetical protein